MVPITPTPVSLFGAPIDSSSSLSLPGIAPGNSIQSGVGGMAHAVSGMDGGAGAIAAGAAGSPSAPFAAPFADLLTEAVGSVERLEAQSKAAIEGLLSGKGVDVHEAMIATQKAAMGFELVLAVRNKALAAYQQVMGMQF